jgi:hypothetical protein
VFLARDAIDHAVRDAHCFSEPHAPLEGEDITRGIADAAKQHRASVDDVTPQVPLTPAGCMREADLYVDARRLSPLQELTALHPTDSRPRRAMSRPWQESFIAFSAPLLW